MSYDPATARSLRRNHAQTWRRRYERGVKVHDLLPEAVETWAAEKGLGDPWDFRPPGLSSSSAPKEKPKKAVRPAGQYDRATVWPHFWPSGAYASPFLNTLHRVAQMLRYGLY